MYPISTIHRRRDGSIDSYYNEHTELRAQALRDIASWLKPAVKFALLTIPTIGAIAAVTWIIMHSAKTSEHYADEISSCAACGHVEWVERQWDDAIYPIFGLGLE